MEIDYENDIIIDESALDVEWLNQPELAIKYGKYWALCNRNYLSIVEQLKLLKARLINECFETNSKATALMVDAFVRTNDEHIDLKEQLVKAQYKLNIAEIAKNEISYSRKMALENLVKLHGQNYFSSPNMPRDISTEAALKNKQRKVDGGVAGQMKRRK